MLWKAAWTVFWMSHARPTRKQLRMFTHWSSNLRVCPFLPSQVFSNGNRWAQLSPRAEVWEWSWVLPTTTLLGNRRSPSAANLHQCDWTEEDVGVHNIGAGQKKCKGMAATTFLFLRALEFITNVNFQLEKDRRFTDRGFLNESVSLSSSFLYWQWPL